MIIILKTLMVFFSNLLDVSFFILPILLVLALFNFRNFRNSPALQFFLLATGIAFSWRFLFCFYNGGGISDRYIAVLPMLFTVLAIPGLALLSRWLITLAALKNIRLTENAVIAVLLIAISAACLGKALNPPDRKPYISEIAVFLKNTAPPDALFIDSTGDGDRIAYYGDISIEARSVRKYTRDKALFFKELKTLLDGQKNPGRKIYLSVRVEDLNEFVSSCKQNFGTFFFVDKYSCRIKKDTVILYEKITN